MDDQERSEEAEIFGYKARAADRGDFLQRIKRRFENTQAALRDPAHPDHAREVERMAKRCSELEADAPRLAEATLDVLEGLRSQGVGVLESSRPRGVFSVALRRGSVETPSFTRATFEEALHAALVELCKP